MEPQLSNGILEDFRIEFLDCWRRLPNKGFFLGLLAAWLVLFQFLGNSTFGYIDTHSLLGWMFTVYNAKDVDNQSLEAHGNFIPFVVLAVFWWKRKELLSLQLQLWWPALLLVGLGLFTHFIGFVVQQPRISIVGFFIGIYGLTGLAWGPRWLWSSFFPFFLFAFMVPLGSLALPITFKLRLLVTQIVESICGNLLGIEIHRVGTSLIEPSGRFQYEVAAACSGIRSLIATIALALIYGWLTFSTWWKRGILLASALPLAVLGNVTRLLLIVIAANIGGQSWGAYVDKGGPLGIVSLVPYIPAFAGLLLLGHWLERPPPPEPPHPAMEAKPI
jgi:exosortase